MNSNIVEKLHSEGRSAFYIENDNLIEHLSNGEKIIVKKVEKKEPFDIRHYMGRV